MTARSHLFALLALAPLTGCGQLLFVEAEAEEICKTIPDVSMPGVPGSQIANLDTGTDYDLSKELGGLPLDAVDGELQLLSLTLIPTRGVPDMGFVQTAKISVVEQTGKEQPVVDYARSGSSATVEELELAATTPPNLFDFLSSGQVRLATKLGGVFPQTEWAMDARACFHVRTRLNYGDALEVVQGSK